MCGARHLSRRSTLNGLDCGPIRRGCGLAPKSYFELNPRPLALRRCQAKPFRRAVWADGSIGAGIGSGIAIPVGIEK